MLIPSDYDYKPTSLCSFSFSVLIIETVNICCIVSYLTLTIYHLTTNEATLIKEYYPNKLKENTALKCIIIIVLVIKDIVEMFYGFPHSKLLTR